MSCQLRAIFTRTWSFLDIGMVFQAWMASEDEPILSLLHRGVAAVSYKNTDLH